MNKSLSVGLFLFVFMSVGVLFAAAVSSPRNDLSVAADDIEWTQLQNNPQRTGRSAAFVAPNYKVRWIWIDKNIIIKDFVSATGNSVSKYLPAGFVQQVIFAEGVQPIIADSKAYFGAINGTLYAVDALTGDNRWDYTTGGPIMSTAGYASGTVIVNSMDGKVYALNSATGTLRWSYQTGAGINSAPLIANNTVYVGSRDGKFYALDLTAGTLKWAYTTRAPGMNTVFDKAPIASAAVLSEDGQTIMFGAENMFFYGLNTANGTEKWAPKKMIGQSFMFGWPVVYSGKVLVYTVSSLPGAEGLMEDVLNSLPADPTWAEEKTAILNWLNQNPNQKTLYVLDVNTGVEPYQVAMGRVTGNNFSAYPPTLDRQNRLVMYWRTKKPTLVRNTACFGTNYCPDISGIDLNTGDRIKLGPQSTIAPELDNGFALSSGGDYLYLMNAFRGFHAINQVTGQDIFVTARGEKYRTWGTQIIYFGDYTSQDEEGPELTKAYANPVGYAAPSVASISGVPIIYLNETNAGFIAAIDKK